MLMGTISRRALLAGFLATPSFAAAQPARRGAARLPLVVLDPGHGGADPGAVGRAGTEEKRVVLAIAQQTRRILEAGGRVRVAMTRTGDRFVPLGRRVNFAREREAALLLSIHADALPPGQPPTRGASVYTLSERASDGLAAALAQRENGADRRGGLRLPSVSPEVQRILLSLIRQETRAGSERLARLAVNALDGGVPMLNQPLRRAGFVVLKAPDVPAALVECGFLSHPGDEQALRQPAHRARVAACLAEAVQEFIGRRSVT